jgi:serine protease Do
MKRRPIVVGGLCVLLSSTIAQATSNLADLEAIEKSFVALADQVSPCVVSIETRVDRRRRSDYQPMVGSGVVIDEAGLILTNHHVIQGADHIRVIVHGRRRFEGTVVAQDPRSDLAVISVPTTGLEPAEFSDLENVRVGQWTLALGNPFGIATDGNPSMSYGIVSSLGRSLHELEEHGQKYYGNLIETTADINPGNSGGPLFNIQGQLIGINTAIETSSGVGEGLGFAIPISPRTRRIISTLASGDQVEYGFLGVRIRNRRARFLKNTEPNSDAVLITDVTPGSPAAAAGLLAEDLVVSYRGIPVETTDHLIRMVGATPVGEMVRVKLYRDRKALELDVTVTNRDLVLAGKSKG